MNYLQHFKKFESYHHDKIHLAAHSHHFWPDVALLGQQEYFELAAQYSDDKWQYFFEEHLPQTQHLISKILHLSHPENISFAQNTHELIVRLMSCFLDQGSLKILTTDSEFHSFSRQAQRLSELPQVQIKKITTDKLKENESAFISEFITALKSQSWDMVFISHVFYNSGIVLSNEALLAIQAACPKHTLLILDGYHSFCALPFDFKPFENHYFYLAGCYKYAMSGEGLGFMCIPPHCHLRPAVTGWFGQFQQLANSQGELAYASDGMRFAGATMEGSAHMRFNSVWLHWQKNHVNVELIHKYVLQLQSYFLSLLPMENDFLSHQQLLISDLTRMGHFLTFEYPTQKKAQEIYQNLRSQGIICDQRAQKLRLGFGLYQDSYKIEQFFKKISIY